MGIHNLAPVFSALKLAQTTRKPGGHSTPVFSETVPLAAMVHYQIPGSRRYASGEIALV